MTVQSVELWLSKVTSTGDWSPESVWSIFSIRSIRKRFRRSRASLREPAANSSANVWSSPSNCRWGSSSKVSPGLRATRRTSTIRPDSRAVGPSPFGRRRPEGPDEGFEKEKMSPACMSRPKADRSPQKMENSER